MTPEPRYHAAMVLRALASTVMLAALPAQSVLQVGNGSYPDIGAAIAAAAPGDIIEVAAGAYPPFTLDKALTITAAPGARVAVLPSVALAPTVLRPPLGTTARIVHIEFRNPWILLWADTRVERGTVWLQDCICEGGYQSNAGLRVTNATAVLDRCIVAGFGVAAGGSPGVSNHGLFADHAQAFASDCQFAGSTAGFDLSEGGSGIAANAATVQCARCLVLGGHGEPLCFYAPAPAVRSTNGSVLSFADCSLQGGNGGPC